jgi:predicted MFS family arabinose efflux permease
MGTSRRRLPFALAAVIVARAVRLTVTAHDSHQREPYGAALRAGFRYVRHDRLVLGIVLMVLATNLLDQAYLGVFIPVWVHDAVDSPRALGLLFAAFGLGAVLGNAVFTALAPKLPRFATFAIGSLLSGAPQMLVMAITHSVAAVATTLLVSGVLCAGNNPILSATVYERVPRHLQARVIGLVRATAWAGIPVGGLVGGLAVERLGLTTALLVVGAVYLLVTLVPFVMPTWRQMDDHRNQAQLAEGGISHLVS